MADLYCKGYLQRTTEPLTMRLIILSFLISLSLSATAQTIPNGDFEQWVPTALFSLDPAEWQTGNTQLSTPVYPDLDACLNDTAMTVEAVPISLGKYGNANVTFAIGAIPPPNWTSAPAGTPPPRARSMSL